MKTTMIPFGLLNIQKIQMSKRGYLSYTDKVVYDPITQTTDILRMGRTEPTTTSNCAGTTGFLSDSDESNDDTGTD